MKSYATIRTGYSEQQGRRLRGRGGLTERGGVRQEGETRGWLTGDKQRRGSRLEQKKLKAKAEATDYTAESKG